MSTELSNGVIIPEEYSDDWYDEMSINLRKLNDVITAASDNATDIQRLDTDKANQSDLTALTSRVSQNETDIIALLSGKANDSDVVHKSGDETIAGVKTFSSVISNDGSYLGNESSQNERTNLCLRSNRDTADKSGAYISRFRANKNQGELLSSDNSFISISFMENETRYTRCFDFGLTDWDADGIPQTYYLTSPGSKGALGTSSRKWQAINGLNPGSLGMPDLSNGIDISSYITQLDKVVNNYTPPSNGWLSIRVKKTSLAHASLMIYQTDGLLSSCETTEFSISGTILPVIANQNVKIYIIANSLASAKFYPCLGNV